MSTAMPATPIGASDDQPEGWAADYSGSAVAAASDVAL